MECQLGDDWEWGDDPLQDLIDAYGDGWVSSGPAVLNNLSLPANWKAIECFPAAIDPSEFWDVDLSDYELIVDSTQYWKDIWQHPKYACESTLVIPFREDLNAFLNLSNIDMLENMGPAGMLLNSFNTNYFDFYVSGAAHIEISVNAETEELALKLAKDQLTSYLQDQFPNNLEMLIQELSSRGGNPDFDETVDVLSAPNWVYLSKSSN